jgi:hypothetical protein
VTGSNDGIRIWSIVPSEPVVGVSDESVREQEERKLADGGQVIEEESAHVEQEVKEEVAQQQPTVSASSSPASAINAAVFQAKGLLSQANRINYFPRGHLQAIQEYIQELKAADSVAKVHELSRLIAQEFELGKAVAHEREQEKKRG